MDAKEELSRGEAFHRAGDLERAEQAYRAVLRSQPTDAHAWFLLGVICQGTGRLEEAVSVFRRSIQLRPEHAPTWNLLGIALAGQGRPAEAEASFRRSLQIQPTHLEAARNLERALRSQAAAGGSAAETAAAPPTFESCCRRAYELCERGRYAEAEPWYHQALAIRPDSMDVLNDLAKVLVLQARAEEGLGYLRRALLVEPANALALVNMAATLFELNRTAEAESAARMAVQLDPLNPSAFNNLGLILGAIGRLSEAEQSHRDGLTIAPDHPELHSNLGNVLVLQGRADEAQSHYRRALEGKPGDYSAHSNWLLSRQYLPDENVLSLAEAHRAWDLQHAAALTRTWRPPSNDPDPERPLRLGFVSADLHRHPVGCLLIRTIEGLRSLDCETFCYHTGSGADDLTARFAAASTMWRPSRGRSDHELADQIRADRIDLLFDLAGHTSKHRLLVFARKPAPIQLTWVGYEGTTGLSAIDYLLADRYHVPDITGTHGTERVIRLPDGYACYDPPIDAPAVRPPPSRMLGHVTFGCFNNPAKVGTAVVAAWAEILSKLPSSRLLLKYRGLDDEFVRRRFLDLFAARGIDPTRVHLEGASPYEEMLDAYGRVDIALDPFPFSGCLTTCLALWMGVPVVTLPGQTFAGRHSFSILSTIGLTETVADDLAQYADIAVGLACDPERLAAWRATLRPRMEHSPLCDGPRFARNFLETLRICWREWCANRPVRSCRPT
jgi:predicted O-linked N-acetylglucosamine transferase (SPINDLY family)